MFELRDLARSSRSSSRNVPCLLERKPRMTVLLSQPLLPMHIEQVVRGIIDVTMLRGPVTLTAGLRREVLRTDDVVAVLPVDHRLARQPFVELAAMSREADRNPVIKPFLAALRDVSRHDVSSAASA